jgi:hypothetical protein
MEVATTSVHSEVKKEWRDGTCLKCSAWMYHMQHKNLNYTPDNKIPIDRFPERFKGGKMQPVQINMTTTKEGIKSITKFLVANEVSLVQAKLFLKHLGLYADAQEKIVDQALQNKIYQFPSSWYDTEDLSVFVEVPMHLSMLGVMKATTLKLGKLLRSISQNATFINHISGKLKVIKKLNIEWCKILEYPTTETIGGWVSENFTAMARLRMWFYSNLYAFNYSEE